MGTSLKSFDRYRDIALTFLSPTGKLSIRPFAAFGTLDEHVGILRKRGESGIIHSMTADRVSYTLDSTLETVNNAEETAGRMATEAGFDDEEVMKISMAVREAAVNAVLHGNAYDPARRLHWHLSVRRTTWSSSSKIKAKGLTPARFPTLWRRRI